MLGRKTCESARRMGPPGEHVRLKRTAVAETPNATHLTFDVLR